MKRVAWIFLLILIAAPAAAQLINLARYGSTIRAAETPFNGTACAAGPASFIAMISAINYDCGGQGIAYSSFANPAYSGCGGTNVGYRPDSMFMQAGTDSGIPFNVGCLKTGDYMKWTVSNAQLGPFNVSLRMANIETGASYNVIIDGVTNPPAAVVNVPNTGSYSTFQTATSSPFTMSQGNHIIQLLVNSTGATGFAGNINWLQGGLSGGGGQVAAALTMTNGPPNIPIAAAGSCAYSSCSWIQANISGLPVSDVYADLTPMSQNYTGVFAISDPRFTISTSSDGVRNVGHIITAVAVPAGDYPITVTATGASGSNAVQAMVHAASGTAVACGDQTTIQNQVVDGRVLLLAACQYNFTGQVTLGNNVMILGAGIGRTIIDGGTNPIGFIFSGGSVNGTQGQGDAVANLTMQNFGVKPSDVGGNNNTYIQISDRWVVRNNSIINGHASAVAIYANNGALVANNRVDSIGQQAVGGSLGLSGDGTPSSATPVLTIGNEANNVNLDLNDACGNSSGAMAKYSDNGGMPGVYITLQNNYIHDNAGPGIWFDFAGRHHVVITQNTVLKNGISGIIDEIPDGTVQHDISFNAARYNAEGYHNPSLASVCNLSFAGQGFHRDGANIHWHDNNLTGDPAVPGNPYGIPTPYVVGVFYDGQTPTTNDIWEKNTINFIGSNSSQGYGFISSGANMTGTALRTDHFHFTAGDQASSSYFWWNGTSYVLGNTPSSGQFCASVGQECDATVDTTAVIASGCTHVACSGSGVGPGGVPQ